MRDFHLYTLANLIIVKIYYHFMAFTEKTVLKFIIIRLATTYINFDSFVTITIGAIIINKFIVIIIIVIVTTNFHQKRFIANPIIANIIIIAHKKTVFS